MKKTFFILLFIPIFLFLKAQTSVYEVSNGSHTIYLGGTIHILKKTDFPLPKAYDLAYDAAETIVLEADLSELENSELTKEMASKMVYQDGRTLKTELDKKTYKLLETACKSQKIPLFAVQKMKPSMVVMMLTMLKMQKMGYTENGVDLHYENKAKEDEKKLAFLETAEFQFNLLNNLGDQDEKAFITYSLKDMNNIENSFNEMKAAWLKGDGKTLVKQNKEMETDFPEIYADLLTKRNKNWIIQIEEMIAKNEKVFILVGAMHLYGNDGLLQMLSERNYTIKQL